ncbi:MAG: hypothetical protein ACPG19_08985 [Saprospiraceae bacterium]
MSNKNYQYRFGGPFNWIIAIVAIFVVIFLVTQLVKILWWLAAALMPILLIATLIINRNVVFDFVKSIRNLYKKSLPTGIIATVLTVVGFPFVTLFLFGKAMLFRKIDKIKKEAETENENKFGEYIEYEEVDSFTKLLNEQKKQERKIRIDIDPPKEDRNNNPYNKLWE